MHCTIYFSKAVKEAEEARSHKWDTDDKKGDFADDDIDVKDAYRNSSSGSSSSAFTYADPPISTSRSSALIDEDGDDDEADAYGDDERRPFVAQAKSTVAVSLVESTLGLPDDKLADEKDSDYIVEENSDDD